MQASLNLGANEIRVLGVLIEKQRAVPDSYPLSLNALLVGCNQKTSREPVMELSESDISNAIDTLRSNALVVETSGGRVTRYAHNLERVLQVPTQSSALLATLMLRGPQTAGELRQNCERLHRFADISTVEAFLHELREHKEGALVEELPRQPGSRENRWMHTLSEELLASGKTTAPQHGNEQLTSVNELSLLRQDIETLKAELANLRGIVESLQGNQNKY